MSSQRPDRKSGGPASPISPHLVEKARSELLPEQPDKGIRLAETGVALLLTLAVALLLARFLTSAGPLWRDEAGSVNLATQATWGEVSRNLEHEAFFWGWNGLVRCWVASGAGTSDAGLRVLGVLIAGAVAAGMWLAVRGTTGAPPMISLALLGLNSTFLTFGASLRGYGLGMLLATVVFWAVWQFARHGGWSRGLLVLAACVLSVHVLCYNSAAVFAGCVAGMIVLGRGRRWKLAASLLGAGALAAVSLVIYVPAIRRAQQWNVLLRHDVTAAWLWKQFASAFPGQTWLAWVWPALAIAVLWLAFTRRRAAERERSDLLLYCSSGMILAVASYIAMLHAISYYARPWYFLVLLALVAVSLDAASAALAQTARQRLIRAGIALLLSLLQIGNALAVTGERRSNMDVVASKIQAGSREGDLVLVSPWYYGVSFHRYYRGPAEVLTLPPMPKPLFHRYDWVKARMEDPGATTQALLAPLEATLRNGHTIWLVGEIEAPPPGRRLPPIQRPEEIGWYDENYYELWEMYVGAFLRSHAAHAQEITIKLESPVSDLENVRLLVMRGYK